MSHIDKVIRAWSDPGYRAGLSADERAALPPHPAGLVELSDADLEPIQGGLSAQTAGIACNTYGTVCSYGWRCFTPVRACA